MNRLKAYQIDSDYAEGSSIAFAESASKAKSMALHTDTFTDEEYIELHAKRAYEFDEHIEKFGRGLLGWDEKSAHIFRENGWHEFDACQSECEWCGLHEFSSIPESTIMETEDADVCQGCLDAEEKKS